ncbi:MAG: hybrid sensor histidine kinase/response regulator [Bacteroidetes bacterium]|nr:hybrid sensor histidine kinase/response regulator [Bacteroidota bacterium]
MNGKDKIKVLYIDDEQNNLISFKAAFRFDYNIFVAINTTEAINHLKANPDISVILSDQKMPDKTGVEFFEEIRKEFPNPIRILITGYADIESVINAINRGHVYRYIKKPWSEDDIRSSIDQGYKFYVTTAMLAVKNEELQKAYNELDKFAYSATHDMRGPILSVLGIIDLAKHTDNLADVKEMMGMMENAMLKLDNYIQNLHDYYSIRRGEVEIADINFDDIVKDLSDIYEVTSKMNNVKFVKNVQQAETFRSDEVSIKIILNNLLSNAFKYQVKNNENKFVELDVNVAKGIANIVVKDNGIGIPENSINQIFNMFYRGNSEEVGSGFGLYNVKDALGKLNGKIDVVSSADGTTFSIAIPNK